MKVLSYNIWQGGADRPPDIRAVIRRQEPDAVALVEANNRANATQLARDLGMHLVFGEANCACHVAWLSRLPIRRSENHRHPMLSKTLLKIEVDGEGGPLRLFATHLASRHDAVQTIEEIPIILQILRPLADQPHLLVGDLNALHPGDAVGTPPPGVAMWGEAVDGVPRRTIQTILEAGYVDCYRTLHPWEPGYTYPSAAPWLRLDYMFASPALAERLLTCDVGAGETAARASDHLPVWIEFD
ncbi:MAG: endonuclease/exonuclease/phosphatase family protein [Thermomicrobiales bacterium]